MQCEAHCAWLEKNRPDEVGSLLLRAKIMVAEDFLAQLLQHGQHDMSTCHLDITLPAFASIAGR